MQWFMQKEKGSIKSIVWVGKSWEFQKHTEVWALIKDLICFNKTLLAKQVWRLMQNTDSITSKILMVKYYPGIRILEA